MDLIFDVGANVGNFTDRCLELYPNCKVVLVEPNIELYSKLKNKFFNKNVVIIEDLVSTESDKKIQFHISNADTISTASIDWINNSRFSNNYKWNSTIVKNTISLDDLVINHKTPDLIKIDVEGYELEVIKGLSNKQKEICFEWAEEQYVNINKTCEHLKSIGYTDFGVIYGDEYLKKPEIYTSWEECEIHNDIDINRKDKWGMIWVK